MIVADKMVVSIHYTLTGDTGETLDSSKGRAPLVYLHGQGGIIPGLERALTGLAPGVNRKVTVQPADAYGLRDAKLVTDVPRSNFGNIKNIEAGMKFQAQTPEGPRTVTVMAANDTVVSVDANHPLAGATLHFDVTVVEVRKATAEELQHGHAHGPGGHHH